MIFVLACISNSSICMQVNTKPQVYDRTCWSQKSYSLVEGNQTIVKLNSYSNASVFLSLCRMRISVFWGQERLTDRSISKRYLKSDIATRVEKSSTSRAIDALDTGFYWSSENALHERFIASSGDGVWMNNANSSFAKR